MARFSGPFSSTSAPQAMTVCTASAMRSDDARHSTIAPHRRRTDRSRGDRRRSQEPCEHLCRARARTAHGRGAAPQIGADAGAGAGRRTVAEGPPRPALRRAAVPDAGRDHPHPVRIRAQELYPPQVPSEAERMAVVATGGYGRGLLAPGSDIDLLFLLPYKQTAWGEQVAEALLYCLWDMGLKVGHATRSVDECIRQAKADMTIRTALLETRYLFGDVKLYQRADGAVRQGSRAGHRAGIRRRQARRARRAPSPRRPIALSGRAQRQGRQGRLARPAYAVLDRQIRLSRARARGTDRARRVRPRRIQDVPPLRGLPVVGPLQHAFPHRPRRGTPVVRHPARYRGAARLHRASRLARRRALHEALLPHRQACRRSHRHPVRRPRGTPGQAGAGLEPGDRALASGAAAEKAFRHRRFRHRQQPHQYRARRRLSGAIRST